MLDALAIASFGQKADVAKPMKHLGSGVIEIALSYRSDAYRVVYAVQTPADISNIRTAHLGKFTIDRLVRVLNRLDRKVSVSVEKLTHRDVAA